jgi:molecular chaperone DnaK (HSP70)
MDTQLKPKNSPHIFGIDLGTSNSAIAVFLKGQAEIIPIEGNNTLPSVVSVRADGEILVGRQARNRLIVDTDNTVASVKREMGELKVWEFAGQAGKQYKPQDISAEILAKLKSGAEQAGTIDLRGTPRYVVVCIPANFDDIQKNATIEAVKLANLDAIKLLEEPVAAAIAYAMEKERDQTILVYDLGGGTFDVSILKVDSTQDGRSDFKILAKEGVQKLGGDDFDAKIMEIVAGRFQAESGVDILDEKKDQGINKKALREAQQKLKEAAEIAKCELTEAETAPIEILNLIKDESGTLHNLETEVSRSEFNEAIRPLLLQSKEAVDKALTAAKLTIDDISRIILVGGSTRVPLVSEMLTEMFGREPYKDTNPDTVVARGAAIFAATLSVPSDPETAPQLEEVFVIENTVTHYLGIETQGGRFSALLEKGQEIPADPDLPLSVRKEFTNPRDNMTEIPIRVYQSSEPTEFVSGDGSKWIGEFFVKIPPKPRGQERIAVTFELDQQNLLKVKATSSISGDELEINRS